MEPWIIDGEIFIHPFNLIISGATSSGKSFLLREILKYKDVLIKNCSNKIIYCYKTWQSGYDKIKMINKNVVFIQGIPSEDQINTIHDCTIIFDDLFIQCINNEFVMDIYTVGSHHRNISAIVISQNVFSQEKFSREISLNCNCMILFKNPRDQLQLQILARQMFSGNAKLLQEAFNEATLKPHGYLLIDLMQSTESKNRIQTGILPSQQRIIYVPK